MEYQERSCDKTVALRKRQDAEPKYVEVFFGRDEDG